MTRYLIRLNGAPWFTITTAAPASAALGLAYAVARGEHPPAVAAITWHPREDPR